eukprot:jgi/Chlat1/4552/Chrsp29S04596
MAAAGEANTLGMPKRYICACLADTGVVSKGLVASVAGDPSRQGSIADVSVGVELIDRASKVWPEHILVREGGRSRCVREWWSPNRKGGPRPATWSTGQAPSCVLLRSKWVARTTSGALHAERLWPIAHPDAFRCLMGYYMLKNPPLNDVSLPALPSCLPVFRLRSGTFPRIKRGI